MLNINFLDSISQFKKKEQKIETQIWQHPQLGMRERETFQFNQRKLDFFLYESMRGEKLHETCILHPTSNEFQLRVPQILKELRTQFIQLHWGWGYFLIHSAEIFACMESMYT